MGTRIGVDEAGRGPVLGSLFVAGVAVADEDALPEGVADSKTLQPNRRQALANVLHTEDTIRTAVWEVPSTVIDERDASLTTLEADGYAAVIDGLATPDATAIVDTVERNTDRYATRVQRRLETAVPVTAHIKADATEAIVSAASIVAKAARERHVRRLKRRYGAVGSGYPSDPTTRAFLAEYVGEHGELPPCARHRWQTSQDVLAAAEQERLRNF